MTPEEEIKFKAIRHKFYRLGKGGPGLLVEMGLLPEDKQDAGKEELRAILFDAYSLGRIDELEGMIDAKEKEILERIGHQGDPCIYCHLPHDEVKPGPCPVRKKILAESDVF